MKAKNVILTCCLGLAVGLFILTFSIGLPIYFRPFYYMQIQPLGITERTGFDYETVKASYDELLDYLTLPGREFGTGAFAHSEAGASHFADCKVLFDLNGAVLLISLAAILVLKILERRRIFSPCRPFGRSVSFTVGAATLSIFLLLGLIVAADFNLAFEVFHGIFFPGKDNWIFDYRVDPIIMAMPQTFFMNCAILIVSSILLISVGMIVTGLARKRKN